MRISDWSSDVCSSDLAAMLLDQDKLKVLTVLSRLRGAEGRFDYMTAPNGVIGIVDYAHTPDAVQNVLETIHQLRTNKEKIITVIGCGGDWDTAKRPVMAQVACDWSEKVILTSRSEEHTSELQSLMRISYAVFCLKKKKKLQTNK